MISLSAWFTALRTSWRSTLETTSNEFSAAMGPVLGLSCQRFTPRHKRRAQHAAPLRPSEPLYRRAVTPFVTPPNEFRWGARTVRAWGDRGTPGSRTG